MLRIIWELLLLLNVRICFPDEVHLEIHVAHSVKTLQFLPCPPPNIKSCLEIINITSVFFGFEKEECWSELNTILEKQSTGESEGAIHK